MAPAKCAVGGSSYGSIEDALSRLILPKSFTVWNCINYTLINGRRLATSSTLNRVLRGPKN